MKILAGDQIRHCQTLLLAGALFLALNSCKEQNDSSQSNQKIEVVAEEPVSVKTMVLERRDFTEEIITNGIIKASKKTGLYFGSQGVIKEINYRNGDYVVAGAIIAQLNDEAERIALKRAKADIQAAQLELKNLMLGYAKEETVSVNDELLNNLEIQSGLKQASQQLEIATLKLKQTRITAPFDGVLGDISYQEYNMIPTNERFCQLMNMENCIVEFSLLESELAMVYTGMSARINILALKELYKGKIIEINPIIDNNGLFTAKAAITCNKKDVMQGMHAEIFLEKRHHGQLAIPKDALVRRSGNEVVFTYKNGKAVWNYVKTDKENAFYYQIVEGLKPGDTLILDGNLKLSHGSVVKLIE